MAEDAGGAGVKEVEALDEASLEAIAEALGDQAEGLRHVAVRRVMGRIPAEALLTALTALRDKVGCRHLSAISGVDNGGQMEVLYHLSAPKGLLISIRVLLPRDKPRITSVVQVYPAAVLFEREAHDLLGIEFEGHPDPRRLLLWEGWPEGEYPLRKDWKPSSARGEKSG